MYLGNVPFNCKERLIYWISCKQRGVDDGDGLRTWTVLGPEAVDV